MIGAAETRLSFRGRPTGPPCGWPEDKLLRSNPEPMSTGRPECAPPVVRLSPISVFLGSGLDAARRPGMTTRSGGSASQ